MSVSRKVLRVRPHLEARKESTQSSGLVSRKVTPLGQEMLKMCVKRIQEKGSAYTCALTENQARIEPSIVRPELRTTQVLYLLG